MNKYTRENYEEYAVEYIEDSMSVEERTAFQRFLDRHPDLKLELEGMENVRLPQLELAFPNKQILLKNTGGLRISITYWRRIAAAIVLLCFVSFLWIKKDEPAANLTQISEVELPYDLVKEEPVKLPDNASDLVSQGDSNPKSIKESEASKEKNILRTVQSPGAEIPIPGEAANDEYNNLTYQEKPDDMIRKDEEVIPENRFVVARVVLIEQRDLRPTYDDRPALKIERSLDFDPEEMENEGRFKIGRLLARANLIPTGLTEEIAAGGLREKIIPESYSDSN
ncbi:MAG: hypothetical protein HKN76_16445 [Saprospiraceae bacterium]|nr:hypothetical protein [Saprospiraceae bacterium]